MADSVTGPAVEDTELVRYWFEFDLPAVGPGRGINLVILDGGTLAHRLCAFGVGVSGYDEEDCLSLIERELDGEPLPPLLRRVRDVDVDQLDLRNQIGVPAWRGIWYPALNLGGPFPVRA